MHTMTYLSYNGISPFNLNHNHKRNVFVEVPVLKERHPTEKPEVRIGGCRVGAGKPYHWLMSVRRITRSESEGVCVDAV